MILYSLREAAALLGISPATLRRLMRSGAVGYVETGLRRRAISGGQLARFVRSRTVKPIARSRQKIARSPQRVAKG
jgi:excisionase family DNA binding protein